MPLLYTPSQLRAVVGIGLETFRHWKAVMSPLQCTAGHSPCYSAGDILAVEAIKFMVENLGVRVGKLAPVADSLFAECNRVSWPVLEHRHLCIDLPGEKVLSRGATDASPPIGPTLLLPLGDLVAGLRQKLAAGNDVDQQMLHFPPKT